MWCDHGQWHRCILIRGIPVLKHSSLKFCHFQLSIWPRVIHDKAFACLYTNFSPAVGVWEGHRWDAAMDTPSFQEALCLWCHKFWSTITWEFNWHTVSDEFFTEALDETSGTTSSWWLARYSNCPQWSSNERLCKRRSPLRCTGRDIQVPQGW